MPLGPLEVEIRSREGKYLSAKNFDLYISKNIAELEREFGVVHDPVQLFPEDSSLARAVFEAGFKLLLDTGVYVVEQERIVKFSEEELKEALRNCKPVLTIGEGKESKQLQFRDVGSKTPPFVFGGYAGTPVSEEDYEPSALSYALEPLVDAIDHGSISMVHGINSVNGAPSEVEATITEVKLLRKALLEAGRPGMHILACESSVSANGNLAAMSMGLLKQGDAHLIPILNELKVNYSQLVKSEAGLLCGVYNAALVDPIIGGFARGAAGTAICAVAEVLASIAIYRAAYVLIHPYHIKFKATSAKECLWVECAVGQAGHYISLPLIGDVWPANGGGVIEMLYEIAANSAAATASGLNLLGPAPANGEKPNGCGLEAKLMAQVGRAVTGLKPIEVVDVVKELVKKYDATLLNPNPGLPFRELYNIYERKPAGHWYEKYIGVKRELEDLGVQLSE